MLYPTLLEIETAKIVSHLSEYHRQRIDPLAIKFLGTLRAELTQSTPETLTFKIRPGAYSTCLEGPAEVSHEVWAYVLNKLEAELIDEKLLIIKLKGALPRDVLRGLRDLINYQLYFWYKDVDNGMNELLDKISHEGAASVELEGGFCCPDAQIKVEPFKYPGVVIEVSHSETLAEMTRKAERYFSGSPQGSIQVVVVLKLGYGREANDLSIHVWRQGVKVVEDKTIDGNTFNKGVVKLSLKDFAPESGLRMRHPYADLEEWIVLDYDLIAGSYLRCLRDQKVSRT